MQRKTNSFIFHLPRNGLGRNDNPNACELLGIFRKLLVCHPLLTSVDHNVITNATKILTVSSRSQKKPIARKSQQEVQSSQPEFELELCYEFIMLEEIEMMDPYESHMCAYVARIVEEKFIRNTNLHKYKCKKCADFLTNSNDKINDELLALKTIESGENNQPSASTFKIIIFANAVMKRVYTENEEGTDFERVREMIIDNLDIDDVYLDGDFDHDEPGESEPVHHKIEFISSLIKTYMTMKSQKIGKKLSDHERGELLRFRKKRAHIEKGQ